MRNQTLKNTVVCILCSLVASVIATSNAAADEAPLDTMFLVEQQPLSNNVLDTSIDWIVEPEQERTSAVRLPEPRSELVSFVKKCAELEAIPLIELSEREDKHVFFGINFDGFVGVYARQ